MGWILLMFGEIFKISLERGIRDLNPRFGVLGPDYECIGFIKITGLSNFK
jgi:hypothetical protein